MARVECEVYQDEIETENGRLIPGVRASCSKCGHETASFGTGSNSVRRCLALMKEECAEDNYYVDETY